MHRHRRRQFERGDTNIEGLIGGVDHLETALHRAEWRGEGTEGRVIEVLAGVEDRMFADHSWSTNLFDLSVGIGDDPVSTLELHPFRSAIGDSDLVGEEP